MVYQGGHTLCKLQQYDLICSLFNNNEPVQWPYITNEPINEFHTLGLATQAFPTLFPFGIDDPKLVLIAAVQ